MSNSGIYPPKRMQGRRLRGRNGLKMDQSRDKSISQAPMLALEAIRIAEQSARAAERSAAGALATLERAESSLKASEERMVEITAAASSAASEATEARLRATEVATEFRSLEERVAEALRVGAVRRRETVETSAGSEIPAGWAPVEPRPIAEFGSVDEPPSAAVAPSGGTTAEFEALWDSFDRKADRIVSRLKELEARTMTVIRTPMPGTTPAESHSPTEGRR